MKSFTEFREEKQRLDPKCWDGYKKKGTKMKGDTRVNDCVKEEEIKENSSADRPQQTKKIKRPKQGDYKNYIDLRPSKLNAPGGRDKVKYTDEAYETPAVKKPVSQMNPAEKKKNNERRTAYNTFQKRRRDNEKAVKDMKGMAPHMKNPALDENIDKTIARHESGIRQANAAMKTAAGNRQMVKHMNALTHHKKALKTAMMRQSLPEEGIKSGHKRPTEDGAGLTQKGVNAHRRENPGSKLQTAVTTPPSKLKPGSKAAGRRKSFCARSRSWTGERGKAARKRWNC